MKFCAVPEAGDTLIPVCTMVGTNVVISVPNGTVRVMVFTPSLITPITSGLSASNSKAVIALFYWNFFFEKEKSAEVGKQQTDYIKVIGESQGSH